ncbi:rCG41356 [Rattus norvegicus]|uniref:RCG41356 n=1 Tax=Rattus norvegicus TaxID=10116 RepID=A6IHA8_RAT|nr:rCG41356 [Rattus norvegicus]
MKDLKHVGKSIFTLSLPITHGVSDPKFLRELLLTE